MDKSKDSNWLDYAYLTGCIVYFVLPTDLIPDFVTGLGYTDDVAVLAMAFKKAYNIFSQTAKDSAINKAAQIFGKHFDEEAAARVVYGASKAIPSKD